MVKGVQGVIIVRSDRWPAPGSRGSLPSFNFNLILPHKNLKWALLALVIVALGVAATAQARIFSVFSEAFAAPKNPSTLGTNSQNMALLGASLNSDPNAVKGGDATIVAGALLSQSGPMGTIANVDEHTPGSDQISVYVVREGDSLSQVAKMFGVSTNTIIWANDLPRSGAIKPGQVLTILPITGVKHTVIKGDTIAKIAKKYGGDAEEIAGWNGLEVTSALTVGQTIIVPDGEITTVVTKPSSGGGKPAVASGYYLRPISGGRRSQGLHGHNGVDLAAAVGTPIYAAADGMVIVSKQGGWNGGYGNYVVIRHDNGTQTLYAHNDTNAVSMGERVSRGDVIGTVGTSGKVTGAHVHFEVRGAANPF